jgi:hypothetical protein
MYSDMIFNKTGGNMGGREQDISYVTDGMHSFCVIYYRKIIFFCLCVLYYTQFVFLGMANPCRRPHHIITAPSIPPPTSPIDLAITSFRARLDELQQNINYLSACEIPLYSHPFGFGSLEEPIHEWKWKTNPISRDDYELRVIQCDIWNMEGNLNYLCHERFHVPSFLIPEYVWNSFCLHDMIARMQYAITLLQYRVDMLLIWDYHHQEFRRQFNSFSELKNKMQQETKHNMQNKNFVRIVPKKQEQVVIQTKEGSERTKRRKDSEHKKLVCKEKTQLGIRVACHLIDFLSQKISGSQRLVKDWQQALTIYWKAKDQLIKELKKSSQWQDSLQLKDFDETKMKPDFVEWDKQDCNVLPYFVYQVCDGFGLSTKFHSRMEQMQFLCQELDLGNDDLRDQLANFIELRKANHLFQTRRILHDTSS